MQPLEAARVLAFAGVVIAVYVMAAGMLLSLLLQRRGRMAPPSTRIQVWIRRAILGLAAFGVLCMAYGRFVEPWWLDVTHPRAVSPKLARGARPVRIVHFSDLHCDARPRLEERLPDAIAAEKPDLIVFTGDCMNVPEGLPILKRCLSRVAAIAPTYAVRGNWDAWFWTQIDLFGGTGVRELDGDAARAPVDGAEVWVAGVAVGHEPRIGKALGAIPPGAFAVFLHHYPDWVEDAAVRRADLYCAGHIHGGQVALPFYGALVTLSRFGKKYEAGLYRVEDRWLYVNRGIGMEGGWAPRVRFCARPEVTVIEVAPGG